jgi:hypothetical protein
MPGTFTLSAQPGPPAGFNPDAELARLNVFDAALAQFRSLGLQPPTVPTEGYAGDLPTDLTSCDDNYLGALLNMCSNYSAFVEFQWAKARSERDAADAQLDLARAYARALIKAQYSNQKLTNDDRKDLIELDPRVRTATQNAMFYSALYSLIEAVRARAQRNWETVSRHITLRGQRIQQMQRDVNVAGVPRTFGQTYHQR